VKVVDLRRAEAVNIDLRELGFQGAERVFVPLQREFRMQSALQQDLVPAECHRLFDLLVEGLKRQNVGLDMIDGTVERAEVAHRRADVRVVDVPIDVVGAVVLRMQAARDRIGSSPDGGQIVRAQQFDTFIGSQPFTGDSLVENLFDAGRNAGDHGGHTQSDSGGPSGTATPYVR
jgi:hypothetical protein